MKRNRARIVAQYGGNRPSAPPPLSRGILLCQFLVLVLLARSALATVVFTPPFVPTQLDDFGSESGVTASWVCNADAVVPNADVNSVTSYNNKVVEVNALAEATSPILREGVPAQRARAVAFGFALPQILTGLANASASGGPATGQSTLYLEFRDLLRAHSPSADPIELAFHLHASGTTEHKNLDPPLDANNFGFGNSSATASVFVWNADSPIQPKTNFNYDYAYWEQQVFLPGSIVTQKTNVFPQLQDGSRWWVDVQLTLRAGANVAFDTGSIDNMIEVKSDFSHTVILNIDPDPSTPDATYSMASGVDYRTSVPEPAAAALLFSAIGCWFMLRCRGKIYSNRALVGRTLAIADSAEARRGHG